jgi:hypothetical protein
MGQRTGRLRARWFAVLAAVLAFLQPAAASAWGYYGHATTGRIALANVKPQTRAAIARLIAHQAQLGTPACQVHSLAEAATWPDCLRGQYWRWAYTFAWHYQTEPIGEPYDARKNCSAGNCVSAQIEGNLAVLSDESLPANVRLEAMAFMVHFAGDIHMPLHSGDNDDKGGNAIDATYGIAPGLNLHSVWDSALAERAISGANPPLVRRYSPAERAELAGGTPADWGRESWELARGFVYANALGRELAPGEDSPEEATLSQEAIVAAVPVAQRRIEQAGLRIADLLDAAFAPGALPAPAR